MNAKRRSFLVILVVVLVCNETACSIPASQGPFLSEPLNIEQARELIQAFWAAARPDYISESGFHLVEMTTPEVWQSFHFQLYSLDHNFTLLIKDDRASLFHQGVFGGGIDTMLVTDLNSDERPELLYSSEVSLSGVFHGCVSLAYETESELVQMPIVAGPLLTFELKKAENGDIEILTSEYTVGRIIPREGNGQPGAEVAFDSSLPLEISDRLSQSGLACGKGAESLQP